MPRHRIEIRGSATPDEAAAIAAAIERFLRDTATTPGPAPDSPWLRAGLLEQAGVEPDGPGGWGDRVPWGRARGAGRLR